MWRKASVCSKSSSIMLNLRTGLFKKNKRTTYLQSDVHLKVDRCWLWIKRVTLGFFCVDARAGGEWERKMYEVKKKKYIYFKHIKDSLMTEILCVSNRTRWWAFFPLSAPMFTQNQEREPGTRSWEQQRTLSVHLTIEHCSLKSF